jgi:AcrR family transcriptional regulator
MAEISEAANRQLTQVGPAALSVRAVARDLGMASSAIYRYVSSRDALLTLLIVEGYSSMADQVEAAVARVRGPGKRFTAIGLACRQWALTNPQQFALIYGSPVPGYVAPQDTIGPATRIPALLIGVLQEADATPQSAEFTARVKRSLSPLRSGLDQWAPDPTFSAAALALGVMAWTHVIGSISFELFGHRHNVVGDSEADRRTYFEFEMRTLAQMLGI